MKLVHSDEVEWSGVSHDPTVKKKVLIKNGELDNITQMARAVMQPGQISSRHKHFDMNEVNLSCYPTKNSTVASATAKL